MSAFIFPFMLLNLFGGIVAGIWLAILGEWNAIIIGLVAGFAGAFLVSILLMPGMLIIGPVVGLASATRLQHSPFFMAVATILGVGYTYCVMGLWAHIAFRVLANSVDADAKIPVIFWAYAASTAVWNYMAQKEAQTGNEWTPMSAFFHQIACVSLMIYSFGAFPRFEMISMIWWYAVPMGVALLIQTAMVMGLARRGY